MITKYFLEEYRQFVKWRGLNGDVVEFQNWTDERKNILENFLDNIDSGSVDLGLPDCFTQVEEPKVAFCTITEAEAFSSYTAHLAQTLWASYHFPQFHIGHLSDNSKSNLLDSTRFFILYQYPQYYQLNYELIGAACPGDPRRVFTFMVENSLIGDSHLSTIVSCLNWCRRLWHHTGLQGITQKENHIRHWNYNGHPPIERVINGTTLPDDEYQRKRNYVFGCHGTIGLLSLMLRLVNIPVEYFHNEFANHHGQAFFPTVNKFLSHGDNPHSRMISDYPSVPYEELLLDPDVFHSRFNKIGDVVNIDNECFDLALKYLTPYILNKLCQHRNNKIQNDPVGERLVTLYGKDTLEFNKKLELIHDGIAKRGGCDAVIKESDALFFERLFSSIK